MPRRIYMDNHATTPCDPRVVEAMLPWFHERPGNAASAHSFGWEAAEAVDVAARQVADLLGVSAKEIVFTSGATESNCLAVGGFFRGEIVAGSEMLLGNLEHPSIVDSARALESRGIVSRVVNASEGGVLSATDVEAMLGEQTRFCSFGWAQGEIGTVSELEAIASLCRERGIPVHSDATQAVGKIPVRASAVDLLSLSAHKMHGPKGIGALFVRRQTPRLRLEPLLRGGGQQGGMRSGTLPVPLIVGFGVACSLALNSLEAEAQRLRGLRDRLLQGLSARLDGLKVNGDLERRLPGNLNLSFAGVEAQAVLLKLPHIGLSAGSACHAGSGEPSAALLAIGCSAEEAHGSLRFGLGRFNTEEDVDEVCAAVCDVVLELRNAASSQGSHSA